MSTGDGAVIDARTVIVQPPPAPLRPSDVPAVPGLTNLPWPRNPTFVNRAEALAQLDDMLQASVPGAVVVHGLAGVGKTAIALQYAHQRQGSVDLAWWITAGQPGAVTVALARLAARLSPHGSLTDATTREAADWALDWLGTHERWLLVFDDVDSPRELMDVVGRLPAGHHLVTSRRSDGWHRLGKQLSLAPLALDASVSLLARLRGGPVATDRLPGPTSEELTVLAEELGRLPLAVEQAGTYMAHVGISPGQYLQRLRRHPGRVLGRPSEGVSAADGEARSVAGTWRLGVEAVRSRSSSAVMLLRTLAWFGSGPIPRNLLATGDDEFETDEDLALLRRYSLVELSSDAVAVHRLHQTLARARDIDGGGSVEAEIRAAQHAAGSMLRAALPEDPTFRPDGWARWRVLLPHVTAHLNLSGVTGADEAVQDRGTERKQLTTNDTLAVLARETSAFLMSQGEFGSAVPLAREATALFELVVGRQARETLTSQSFLATALRGAGQLGAALEVTEAHVRGCEAELGADDPDTLASRSNLAYLLALRGDTTAAVAVQEPNAAAHRRVLGGDHRHTLNAYANLAGFHRDLGDLPRACALYEELHSAHARTLGEQHPETVTVLSNLAYTYQLADRTEEALPLHEQVLRAREEVLGASHPHTALARALVDGAREGTGDPSS